MGHAPTSANLFYLFIYCHAVQLVGPYFPNQGSNLGPCQWKHRVLTTGPPGNSLFLLIGVLKPFTFLKINLFILFIYFWLLWVFVVACGLSLVAASGAYSSLQCMGFLLWWLLLLRSMGSRCMGFSSCSMQAQ